jgi:hypothetical protein
MISFWLSDNAKLQQSIRLVDGGAVETYTKIIGEGLSIIPLNTPASLRYRCRPLHPRQRPKHVLRTGHTPCRFLNKLHVGLRVMPIAKTLNSRIASPTIQHYPSKLRAHLCSAPRRRNKQGILLFKGTFPFSLAGVTTPSDTLRPPFHLPPRSSHRTTSVPRLTRPWRSRCPSAPCNSDRLPIIFLSSDTPIVATIA